jgi:hypothetical protein
LLEDNGLYADIQRGLAGSPHKGMLGRCEERIHAFQHYVLEACDCGSMTAAEKQIESRSPAKPDSEKFAEHADSAPLDSAHA